MMSLGLTKPGMRSANLTGKIHPITGLPLVPLGYLRNGAAVWPVIGAAPDPDDPDDPDFTGEGDDSEDDDEDDEDDEPKGKKRPVKKRVVKDDDEDDDDEDDESRITPKSSRQAMRYRRELREAQKTNAEMAARLKALENKDKPADEVAAAELTEAREKAERLAEKTKSMTLELAFFKSNTVDWVDPADALALVDLDDVEIDESGTVDAKALRLALRDLAKRKPHLVKKSQVEPEDDEDDEDDDEEPRSRRSAPRMNGRRKGKGKTPSREELARKFPVIGRL
jgi:hypothetical protein